MGRDVTRRRVLRRVLGGAATLVGGRAAAAGLDDPPPFGNARYQFTVLRPQRMVPPVPMTRLGGGTVTFDAFRGKVVLVNFWATWCPACRTELPSLDRLQQAAGGRDLQVIAVSLDLQGSAVVAPFLRKLNIRQLEIYLDPEARIARAANDDNPGVPFGRYGMPISYIVDRVGRIAGYLVGDADWTSDGARRLLDYYAGGRNG
ncbi:TlpA disulfide reductase family protein [Rhodopseudomonas sp. B29]|uniref:TlpA disulfide reductase family protein n=1 Tax=Rhodopseudomonas sp. B29 TaxID=95607 RepID=UPI001FCBE8F1|nr:TlpA disulfide reductase family protein [Rhodopseudomonas sp. B29]